MIIGKLKLNGFAALAPMAGVADRAMREICINFGAASTTTELISAKGIVLGDRKSKALMSVTDGERPIGIQLFGYEPDVMARAVEEALEFGPEFIDINMGCPAPKVANNGSGSAVLKNPKLAGELVAAAKKVSTVPVTAKIRAGYDKDHVNAVEVSKYLEAAGVDAITVHGRTREQMYAPPVNMEIIKDVKSAVSVPIIANGDITSAKDAANMYEYTGCDFIMVGRAAMGAPWIFSQINAYLKDGTILPTPPVSERMRIMLKQISLMHEYKSERTATLESRKYAAWYMKGIRSAAELRRKCAEIESFDDVIEISKLAIEQGEI